MNDNQFVRWCVVILAMWMAKCTVDDVIERHYDVKKCHERKKP